MMKKCNFQDDDGTVFIIIIIIIIIIKIIKIIIIMTLFIEEAQLDLHPIFPGVLCESHVYNHLQAI